MKTLIRKIKNYKPSKYICYLYFFVPLFVCSLSKIDRENDIWFLLKHGEYILKHGFPHIEPFSMHQNFSFVMQQWLSSVIFYISHKILGQYGILLVMIITNILMLYFLYKLCMLISENKFRLSIVITCITDIFLLLFMIARPWIFTMLNLIIVLYIMELFYKKNNRKALYFLPLISLIQINIQSSMWFMLFIFMLPYIVDLFLKERRRLSSFPLIIILMFICGFINPYGLDNILYVVKSYGNYYINNTVSEMLAISLNDKRILFYSYLFYFILAIELLIYIFCKKGRFELRHLFLFLGVSFLGLKNLRSMWIFIIGTIPFLSSYLKPYFKKLSFKEENFELEPDERKKYYLVIVILCIYTCGVSVIANSKFTNKLEKGIDAIYNTSNVNAKTTVYTSYNNGSYAEYRNLKPYIDSRAEIFIKKNNHKEDIMKEYYLVYNGYISYDKFINKYKFDYMIIMKNEAIYTSALKDKNYKSIYYSKKYKYRVFERIENRK